LQNIQFIFRPVADPCETNNGGCTHNCLAIGFEAQCSCFDGYELGADNRTCTGERQLRAVVEQWFQFLFVESFRARNVRKKAISGTEHLQGGGGSREWRPPPSALRLQRKLPGELTGVFLLSDINECARDGGNCSHSCVNTLGSYTCVCNPGYELGMDERTCYSKSGPYFSIMAQDATAPIVRARWSDNLAFRVVQTVIMFFDMCGFDAYCALWRLQFPGANKATVLCLSDEKLALQVSCLRFGRLSMLTIVQQMRC